MVTWENNMVKSKNNIKNNINIHVKRLTVHLPRMSTLQTQFLHCEYCIVAGNNSMTAS